MASPLITSDLDSNFRAALQGGTSIPGFRSFSGSSMSEIISPESIIRQAAEAAARTNYAPGVLAATGDGIRKTASSGIIYTQPIFFSPIHTPINWQIPSKRREIMQWSIVDGQLLREDFTYVSVHDFVVEGDTTEDSVTGGIMWEHPETVPIASGTGRMINPSKWSARSSCDKRSFEFFTYGYHRGFAVTEEHGVYVLDGHWWRKKQKKESNTRYRRDLGIPPNGVVKVHIPETLIVKKDAKDVSLEDYLVTPIMPFPESHSVGKDMSYLIGLCAADGCIQSDNAVNVTSSITDKHVIMLDETFENAILGLVKCVTKPHASSANALRTTVTGNRVGLQFGKYLTGKHTKKKFTKDVFDLPEFDILEILGGYFDGDGSYVPEQGILVANNYSEDMADQIWWMLVKCGIKASIGRYPLTGRHYPTTTTHYYRIFVPSSEVTKVAPYMRSGKVPADFSPKTARELKFFHEENGQRFLCQPISDIRTFLYSGIGHDMQIDPEKSYVLSGFKISNCRYYMENEPKVATSIEFYSRYPINGFVHECHNRYVKRYYDKLSERLNLIRWLRIISHEAHLLGDCFPFLEAECERCGGTGAFQGRVCNHEGGSFKRIVILNPESVEVYSDPIHPDVMIAFVPNEELRNLIMKRGPGFDRFSVDVRNKILSGMPILLDNRNVSHVKYGDNGYNRYGVGMVRRLFPMLAYKTKLMTAQWIVSERLILPIKIVKIGSDLRPASPQDLANAQALMAQIANDPNMTLVTHHNFELDFFGAAGKVLQLTGEFEIINQEILDGLGINKALLNGEGPCATPDVEVLTENGWKKYYEVFDGEKLAGFDPKTGKMIFEHFKNRIVRNYDGDLVHFKTDTIDMLVTANHRMWVQENNADWHVSAAENVKYGSRMRASFCTCEDQPMGLRDTIKTIAENVQGYETTSKLTADKLMMSALRMGYYASVRRSGAGDTFIVDVTSDELDKFPVLDNSGRKTGGLNEPCISRIPYKGIVWCFEMPNEFLVLRRNGKPLITMNTYCVDDRTRVLSDDGFKLRSELDIEKHSVLTYNQEKNVFEYQKAVKKYEYDWDSDKRGNLLHFKSRNINCAVTPEHKMLVMPKGSTDWTVKHASEIKPMDKFRTVGGGFDSSDVLVSKKVCDIEIAGDDFIELMGYYLSEGYTIWKPQFRTYQIRISQNEGEVCDRMEKCLQRCGFRHTIFMSKTKNANHKSFIICSKDLAAWMSSYSPGKAREKRVPRELMSLNMRQLKLLFDTMCIGDGSAYSHEGVCHSIPTANAIISGIWDKITYTSASSGLADDILELAVKLGYYARKIEDKRSKNKVFRVYILKSPHAGCPAVVCNKEGKRGAAGIISEPYKGKVWCVEVPNHFIVTELDGMISIHGNSNAAIGVEVMIDKLETWRTELAQWVEQKIYLPIAVMKGFVEKNEWGEMEYIYPRIKWNIMHLRDQQQYRTFMTQLHEKNVISTQRLLETFDIDYDEEVELIRWERAQGALGGAPQPGAELGGGFGGGMPGLGGSGGGPLPELGGLGGGMEEAGSPALGGGGPAGGGAPAAPPAGPPGAGMKSSSVANIKEFGGMVLKQRTREKIISQRDRAFKAPAKGKDGDGMVRDGKGRFMMTSNERELLKGLVQSVRKGEIRFAVIPQHPVKAGAEEYTIDFAMPQIKLGLEVDGALFHSTKEQIADDRRRDDLLAQQGWTIVRFTDRQVETQMRQVIDSVIKNMIRKENWLQEKKG